MKRYVSGPALALLRQAELSPLDIDAAMDELVKVKASTILRRHHPLVQAIARTTGINAVQISRRSRYLLVEIEQQHRGDPAWQYRERAPRTCIFSCRGQLPATIEGALNGELLEKLVLPTAALAGTTIGQVGATGDGWLSVTVTPPWHLF